MFCGQIKRTITQSSACRWRVLLPANVLGLGSTLRNGFVFLIEVYGRVGGSGLGESRRLLIKLVKNSYVMAVKVCKARHGCIC